MADQLINEVGSVGTETNDSPFADFQIVDDDGKPVDGGTAKAEDGKGKNEQTPPSKESEKKTDDKTGQQKPPQVAGFESKFFKPTDKGESEFDAEGAFNFLAPKQGSKLAFAYQRPTAPAAEAGKEAAPPKQPENPYLKMVREEREYQANLRKQNFAWPEKFQEGINKGYNAEQAAAYANKTVQDLLDTSFSEWKAKRDEEEAERRFKNETSTEESRKLRITAEGNIAAVSSELGGSEAFQQFIVGYQGADGKWVNGIVTDAINLLFDMQNPDIKNPTQEDMNQWWYKFTSNMSNLQFLVDYGLSKLTRNHLDKMIAHGKKVDAETARQKQIGRTRAPSGIKAGAPSSEGMEDINGFIQPRGMATV